MKAKEDKFTSELEVYRTEVQSAVQYFYSYLAINTSLARSRRALALVNRTPLFWRTNNGALHAAFFITLGRVFDQKSRHNIDRLLTVAQQNHDIFSSDALRARKLTGSSNAVKWIDQYMKTAYVPTKQDFRKLRIQVDRYRKIYNANYRDIRHKVYAHKDTANPEEIKSLYARTNIGELQRLAIFLNRMYESLWELYHNGRKPILKPMKYSAERMWKHETPEWQSKHVQERMVGETKQFFKLLSSVSDRN